MSRLNPQDPLFVKKMYQYNRKFRDYIDGYIRSSKHSKDEVLKFHVAREVALYYHSGDQTEEPEATQTVATPSC